MENELTARRAEIATEDERDARKQEPMMHNWFAIETEAEFRRQEWERAVVAEARADLARVARVKPRWMRLPQASFSGLKGLSVPRLSLAGSVSVRSSAECAC